MRIRLTAVCAALVLGIAITWAVLMHTPAFTITGDLSTPLRPGVSAPLDLAISNPQSYPITVTSVVVSLDAVTVRGTGAPSRCTLDNFSIIQTVDVAPIQLAPHAHATLTDLRVAKGNWPKIHMLKSTGPQNICQSVALKLGYHAAGNFWDNLWSHR
jgi:hypothetical protein